MVRSPPLPPIPGVAPPAPPPGPGTLPFAEKLKTAPLIRTLFPATSEIGRLPTAVTESLGKSKLPWNRNWAIPSVTRVVKFVPFKFCTVEPLTRIVSASLSIWIVAPAACETRNTDINFPSAAQREVIGFRIGKLLFFRDTMVSFKRLARAFPSSNFHVVYHRIARHSAKDHGKR
jgi:hypothetical protein